MTRQRRTLRIIALLAAYVIGLQALLLPLSVAAGGSLGFSICSSATSVDSPQPPVGHDTGCPCAAGCGMQCCVHALAAPPQITIAYVGSGTGVTAPLPPREAVRQPAIRGPQSPRAPPVA